jgi:hypothetical protein
MEKGHEVWYLQGVGAIKSVVGELGKYELDLVGVQEEGYEITDNYTFFYGKWSVNHHLGTGFSYIID